jgi:hypothetical protein
MLQEQLCDQRHQGMPMQTPPRAALEVIKPELFLELLVRGPHPVLTGQVA